MAMAPTIEKKVSSNYIHDDIVFSIFSKLPVKSIKRFSCACKSWSFLFENPNFINMFRNNLLSKSHPLYDDACLILNHFSGPDYHWNVYLLSGDRFENKVKVDLPPSLPIENGFDYIRILGSAINGTLCIYDYHSNTRVALWNPATQEVKAIPPSHGVIPNVNTQFHLHGFGYDHVKDDYKVIQHVNYFIFNDNPCGGLDHEHFWEIYSLKSNSWKKINFDMPTRYQDYDTDVYLNGMCHWWGGTTDEAYMVSFNWCNEDYFITPSPLEDVPGCFDVSLVVLNGFVAIISNYKETNSFQISIIGELGVKESWIRLFDVEPLSCIDSPIGAWKKGNIFFRKENHELAFFDLTTGVTEEIGVKGERFWCQIVMYKRNLLPIGGIYN